MRQEPENVTQAAIRMMELAGVGNSSMGVYAAIVTLVDQQGGFGEAEDWLNHRGLPTPDDRQRVKWWDNNIERYFMHKPNGESGLQLRPEAGN